MTPIRPVSIIVCTRNRAERLPGVINQLRLQTYPEDAYEIIVVDNGSTDATADVVRELAARPGAPVRYICESCQGITLARNRGAEAARHPYLTYTDDDCSFRPDWLAQLVRGFDLDDDVEVVGGQVVLDWDQQEPPAWLGPELERWLAANRHLGAQPQVWEKNARVIECNMALTRAAWLACGGFLGMEQFGSKHMAAGEVLYLLVQIERRGGKVAYVPDAIVHHHAGLRSRRWMVRRAYWQGVSDGLLDYLVYRRSWLSALGRAILDAAAMVIFLGVASVSYLAADTPKGLFHSLRAVRRLGLILSELRLVGDWPRARSWASAHGSRS